MNEWMTYALRDDTTKWMMSTFWYPRVLLVSTCDRLHEILIPFPFSESFTIVMCFCCLSFSIPISELIMSCLAMGMLLSILWWKFEQYLHCLIFFSSTSVIRTCPGWLAYSWRPAGQNSAAEVTSAYSLSLSRGSKTLRSAENRSLSGMDAGYCSCRDVLLASQTYPNASLTWTWNLHC